MYAESNVTSGRVHMLNNDVSVRCIALKIAHTQISNPTATPHQCDRMCMELIVVDAEAVPAVAAELDITSKPGTKRKRSCHSATERTKSLERIPNPTRRTMICCLKLKIATRRKRARAPGA